MKEKYILSTCILLSAVIVWCSRQYVMSGGDPAAFFLAVTYDFNMEMMRPHTPGYLWFVYLWKGIHFISGIDIFSILILCNIGWISLAIVGSYLLAKRIFTGTTGVYAALLIATNPVLLYYASTGKIYPFDAAFSVFFVYAFLRTRPRFLPIAMLLFGLSGGFRLSSVIAFFPVIASIYFFRKDELLKLRSLVQSVIAFAVGTLVWFLTMSSLQGGAAATLSILFRLNSFPFTILNYVTAFATFFFWMVNLQMGLLMNRAKIIMQDLRLGKKSVWILLSWIFFPSAFFILKHYQKAYILILLPAFALLTAYCLTTIAHKTKRRLLAGCVAAGNLGIFFFLPFYPMPLLSGSEFGNRSIEQKVETFLGRAFSAYAPSYEHLRVDEEAAASIVAFVKNNTQPGATILFDPSATEFVRPRSIETAVGNRDYLMIYPRETNRFTLNWQGNIRQDFSAAELLSREQLTLITDTRLIPMYSASLVSGPTFIGQYISIFTVKNEKIPILWEQMKNYFSK